MDGKEKRLTELVGAKPLLHRHHQASSGLAWMRVACMSFFKLIAGIKRKSHSRKKERKKEKRVRERENVENN